MTIGHCPIDVAPFVARLGFTVVRPSAPIFIPSKDGEINPISIPNAEECWFYRQGLC